MPQYDIQVGSLKSSSNKEANETRPVSYENLNLYANVAYKIAVQFEGTEIKNSELLIPKLIMSG